MSAVQQVGFSEKLIRSICKIGLMRQNDFNLASILCNYRTTMNKSFTVNYCGSAYQGRIDNRSDWFVYFFGHSDASRINFVRKIGAFLKDKTGRPFTCYDLGASRGDFGLAVASVVDHVVSFEQSHSRFEHLLKNMTASDIDNMLTFNIKLSDEEKISSQCHTTTSKFKGSARDHRRGFAGISPIAVKRGDTVIEECDLPSPDLIRINAGNDYRSVLRGFESALEASQPIILIEQSMSSGHRFADETDLRSVLYEDARLFSLSGSPYRIDYRLDCFDPEAARIVCYPKKVNQMIEQEVYRMIGLPPD